MHIPSNLIYTYFKVWLEYLSKNEINYSMFTIQTVTNKVFCDQTQNNHTKHTTYLERNLLRWVEKLF